MFGLLLTPVCVSLEQCESPTMSNIINKIFPSKRNTKQSGYPNQVSSIGQPFEVRHNVHVGINIATGKIEGLPEPWRNLIKGSNISQSEQLRNPEAVINALKLVTYSMKRKPEKYLANQDMINSEIKEIEDLWPRSKESSKVLLEEDEDKDRKSLNSELISPNHFLYR